MSSEESKEDCAQVKQELDVHALPVVVIQTQPMPSVKNKDDDKNDSQPMGQVIVKPAKGQEQIGADKKPISSVLLPCERCTSMKVDFAPITTCSKTTRKGKTGENSKGTDINTLQPAPMPEEPAVNIKMLHNPPAGTSTSLPDTAPDAAPLASTDDFPPDH
ncbi:hypothetical protein BDR04DRAFT_1118265 [Suillus decipiens]|nr:hypothetical protein BDR04DRAFT_1118265 [Suillus decipiens]